MIRIDRKCWRCWVMGRRLHHGLTGVVFVVVGTALVVHDRRDWPWLPAKS